MSHTKLFGCASRKLLCASLRVEPNEVVPQTALYLGKVQNVRTKVLNMKNLNPNVIALQYAVRGPLVIRANEISNELDAGKKKPFDTVIRANIGDAHAMGQEPISFIRQVISCTACPSIMDKVDFPDDVRKKAKKILSSCGGGSMGSYTMSYGIETIRKSVASYIEKRDGHKCDFNNVCLTNGASVGIKHVLQLFSNSIIGGKHIGVMIPIPQYPLYSATLSEYGLGAVGYLLDEDNNWGLSTSLLNESLKKGQEKYAVKAIVFINPGNPTGQVLSRKNIEDVIKFAYDKKLFIMADEVYQDNVYAEGCKFHSFKKVSQDLGSPYNKVELASFMSASKCYMGECGLRGGWMELINMDPEVQAQLYKALSAVLCANSIGQAVIECVAQPPKQGDASYELFSKQKSSVLASLAERATMIVETFNNMKGFKCNMVQGAMYAFPSISLPQKAMDAAKKDGKAADVFYAFRLLEETGICIIPGTGFGQRPGTYHFRTTLLPQVPLMKKMLKTFQQFHDKFCKQYE